ncbi:hypothetical protein, partial [Burkholderia sp. GbtcB21]|uniref:hypothetical protein n=1 Tax=Burkholderia sp. GbtcB21 TaxID=2824766 RepID=UPI001C301DA7
TNVHNTASTFKPYDPGQAIGDTQPTLPDPPPPPSRGGGCGGFLPVIAIVVAVVATVFTAGALAAPAGASLGTIMSTGATAVTGGLGMAGAGAAAVGGAVGAAAGQGVMIAGGAQRGLDWKGIALGAVGAGVTAGVGATGLGQVAGQAFGPTGGQMAMGAARSMATQGIGVATGLQHSFDWKGVAASAISAGVGAKAGEWARNASVNAGWGEKATQFASGMSSGMAAGVTSTVVRGGSLGRNVGAIAMDAIASTIGNMVASRMASQSTSTELRTQQAIDTVNGQVLSGGVGSAGTGFVPARAPYIRFGDGPQASAAMAMANYDTAAGIEQARAQRIAELQSLADQPVDLGFSGIQVLIEGVGSTGGPVPQPSAELRTIRNLNWFEGQLAFNPVAQAAQGFVDRGLGVVSGVWNVVAHPLNTAAAIGGHYANAYEAGNLGGTILREASGIAAGVVKGAVSPIDALYRRDEAGGAYRLGGSMLDAALSAGAPGAVGAATRLTGSALERGAAVFGPAFDRAANSFLVNRGMMLNAVPESGGFGGAVATLSRVESRFAGASREVGFIIDSRSGDILAVRRAGLGNGTQISLDAVTDFPLMSGNVFTHNHPLGGNLSPGDVSTAIGSGALEFRAVTSTRTTSITFANPPEGLIGAPGPAVLFMNGEKSAIAASYRAGLADGSLIPPTDLATKNVWLSDYFVQQLSARNPWIQYTVTPR